MNQDFTDKLNKIILLWTTPGIKLNFGISSEDIKKLEADLNFSFEKDFHSYLKKINGFVDSGHSDDKWFSFWAHYRIKIENLYGEDPKEVIWFADHSLNLCIFGFHRVDKKIYTHYEKMDGLIFIANSFNEFIDLYLEDAYLLLR